MFISFSPADGKKYQRINQKETELCAVPDGNVYV